MKAASMSAPAALPRNTAGERVEAADWVDQFVEEERRHEQALHRDARANSARVAAVREHLHDLMDGLRDRVERDVDAFSRRLPDRAVTIEDNPPGGGFIVRRGRYPEARLTVEPHPDAGTIRLQYLFASESGTFAPKPRDISVAGDGIGDVHFVEPEDHTTWRSLNELSRYLLVPVFSGQPR